MNDSMLDDQIRTGLRTLAAEAGDPPPFDTLSRPGGADHRSRWALGVAAAAAVAVLLAGLIVVAGSRGTSDGVTTVPPAPPASLDTLPAPTAAAPTTAPSASTVPTTAPPTTAPPTTAPPTTALSTSVAPGTQRPQGLDGWPVRSSAPADVDDVPTLLPAAAVPGTDEAIRFTWADDGSIAYTQHVQILYDAARPALLQIRTTLGDTVLPPDDVREDVDISGWDSPWSAVYFQDAGTDYLIVDLVTPSGGVTLIGSGLTDDELIEIAQSLQRRPLPEAGWDLGAPALALTPFAESGTVSGAGRSVVWRDSASGTPIAELGTATENADALVNAWWPTSTIDAIDLDGAHAIVAESGGRVTIAWATPDGIEHVFAYQGDRATAEQIVRSVRPVDESEWLAATAEPAPGSDGCQGMFC